MISTTGAVGMNDFHQWWDAVWAQAVHDQQLLGKHAFEVNRAKQYAESALHATIVVHTANAIEFLKPAPLEQGFRNRCNAAEICDSGGLLFALSNACTRK